MILRSKYLVFLSLASVLVTGIYVYIVLTTDGLAFSAGAFALFLLSLGGYFYIRRPAEKTAAENLKNSKDVIYSGAAGQQKEDCSVHGMLFLLQDKIIFRSTKFNKVRQETVIFLNDIKEVSFAKTHKVHEKIIVIVTGGRQERFLVKADQLWLDEIENALMHNSLVNKGCEGKAV